ncbi:VanZ family protein [Quadrisphaera sp. KR29]|uniref:VanZ family protein n=1 Tax=Quadrisphaera sp. KR29 TaxID=3461391 RepID=UPI004044B9D8
MTDPPTHGSAAARPHRLHVLVVLLLALAAAAALTLRPVGDGWAWGAPVVELRWYAQGLRSPGTVVQLVGNLFLLVPAAVAAVLLQPRLARLPLLVPSALATGLVIEVLQWWLPLGRVVSPVDATLNAAGALLAGLLTGLVVGWPTARPPDQAQRLRAAGG